jgi:hypothetical protein
MTEMMTLHSQSGNLTGSYREHVRRKVCLFGFFFVALLGLALYAVAAGTYDLTVRAILRSILGKAEGAVTHRNKSPSHSANVSKKVTSTIKLHLSVLTEYLRTCGHTCRGRTLHRVVRLKRSDGPVDQLLTALPIGDLTFRSVSTMDCPNPTEKRLHTSERLRLLTISSENLTLPC